MSNTHYDYDAVIVGSGPNGFSAAITLAQAGRKVLLMEAKDTLGGGMRSAELTLPGFVHDVCSAAHPLGIASPFFRNLPPDQFKMEWINSPAPLAHPLDDGSAVVIERSVKVTADHLGRDGAAYELLMSSLAARYKPILREFLGPLRFPRYPFDMANFGVRALSPASTLAKIMFRDERARAVFAGMAAHSMLPLEQPATAAFGLMLGLLAHAVGWPLARGGSQHIADALAAYLRALGGEIVTGQPVKSLADLPVAPLVLMDITPRQLLQIAGDKLPVGYRRQLESYRYGAGIFKIDYALSAPIPWKAKDCARAATVHLGGSLSEISLSERDAVAGRHSAAPFILLVQPTLFDSTRAPAGKHIAWVYCHVPNGSTQDMTDAIEAQIERFAPGFRDCVLARHTSNTQQIEAYNPNYIGGDINGGVQDLRQLFTRPTARLVPYSTPIKGLYLCSSSTPPGGGVHGMGGYFAAQAALASN